MCLRLLQRNMLYYQNHEDAIGCVKEFINKNLNQDLSRGESCKRGLFVRRLSFQNV